MNNHDYGLLVEENDVSGGIAQFLTENGYYSTIMTQYEGHPVYIQSLQIILQFKGDKLEISRTAKWSDDDYDYGNRLAILLADIALSEPNSLDQLLTVLNKLANLLT